MKLAGMLLLLCLAAAFGSPCAAQGRRVGNHAGLHPVAAARGKWGFIDRTGSFRIPPRYDGAGQFSEGVAYAWLWDGERRKDGVVDADGKFTELPATNDSSFVFRDGLARFQTPLGQQRKYGYMDKTGRVVIPPQFDDSGHFSEGLAWVSVLKERKWLYGFIDKTGKVVIEPQFVYQPGDFVDGLAKVVGQTASGFIDRAGRFRITVESDRSGDYFSEGLLAIIRGDPPRGVYLKRDGEVALEIPFWQQRTAHQRSLYSIRRLQLAPFSEGLAPVLSFNKIGFIDGTGKVVIEPLFRETSGFSEGLAAVKIIGGDGEYVWGYIDRAGRFAVAPRFGEAHPFAGGLARVSTAEGRKQLIDGTGKVIWQL
ncbi:MAG: WG repeat-containing protein [Pyrinomonadaceae bacterium]